MAFGRACMRNVVLARYFAGGLNIKDFPTVCRGGTKVSSLSVCDMLDAIIHMVFIAKYFFSIVL